MWEDRFGGEGLSDQEWLHTMQAICHRAASTGFTNDSLGLHPGFEAERQACLDVVKRGQIADGIAVPHALLDSPFPPSSSSDITSKTERCLITTRVRS